MKNDQEERRVASSAPTGASAADEAAFDKLFASIAKGPYAGTQIRGEAIERLAVRLVSDAEGLDDIAESLRVYFSLDSQSVEAVLAVARRVLPEVLQVGRDEALTGDQEAEIARAVAELNALCMREHKVPFHRATLLQAAKTIDGSEPASRLANLVLRASGVRDCSSETYPRYVSSMLPWKLQFSTLQSFRRRPEDAGCNVHMQYRNKIRAWVGLAPSVYLVVAANQWGMKLAANDIALFVKAWTLAPYGFLPPLLALKMPTRKY